MDSGAVILLAFPIIFFSLLWITLKLLMLQIKKEQEYLERIESLKDESDGNGYIIMPDGERRLDYGG